MQDRLDNGHKLLKMVTRNKIFLVHCIQQLQSKVKNSENRIHGDLVESYLGIDSIKKKLQDE
jgi:hypothetical protein